MNKTKLFLSIFLFISCFLDIITMSLVSNFKALESNPLYLTIGFWGFVLIKLFINIMFVYLLYKYSKSDSNMLSFMTYYLLILFSLAQIAGSVINTTSMIDIYNDVQEKNGNKYDSVFELTNKDITPYVASKKTSIIYYFSFVLAQILIPIAITMVSFYLWNKNENQA